MAKNLLPSQVTENAARKQIKAVSEALDFADWAFSGESARMIFTQLNDIAGRFKNSMFVDPDATAAALQEAIRDGSQQRIQSLVNEHAAMVDLPYPGKGWLYLVVPARVRDGMMLVSTSRMEGQ